MIRSAQRPPWRTHLLAAVVVAFVSAGTVLAPAALAAADATRPAPAATAAAIQPQSSLAASLLGWVNHDRAARHLRPLRADVTLTTLATTRAQNLSNTNVFSHAAAGGDIGRCLSGAHYQWYGWAEDIAWSNAAYGGTSVRAIYLAWRNSPPHWTVLMSSRLNYIGFGIAYRASDHRTFSSAVLSESRDHTRPAVRVTSHSRSGTSVSFTWHGSDAALQTHWRGLRDFDVQYRIDNGAWRLIRTNTTGTSVTLRNRPRGHSYSIRIQARDWAGNLSAWTAASTVAVP